MLLRDDQPDDMIALPPIVVTPGQYARHIVYRIDPLFAQRVVVTEPSRPCRVDGELDAGALWKARTPPLQP